MKPLSSAKTSCEKLRNGQIVLTIQHDVIRGVSPQMLSWWFQNLDGTMELGGRIYPRYLVWHPVDHIHWELVKRGPHGSSGTGAYFQIVEAFAAQQKHFMSSVEYVEKCDEEGLSLVKRICGFEVFRLEHRFTHLPYGTQYDSRMVVGSGNPLFGWKFNRWIRPRKFSDESAHAWLKHNIEEVGNFEVFLPQLYSDQGLVE